MKNKKNKINEVELYALEKEIRAELNYVNDGKDYNIGIDIVARSRELSDLFVKVNEFDKAIEVLVMMIDFCHNVEPLNKPQFISPDVARLLEIHTWKHDRQGMIIILEKLIDRYPDYSSISEWEKQLKILKKT